MIRALRNPSSVSVANAGFPFTELSNNVFSRFFTESSGKRWQSCAEVIHERRRIPNKKVKTDFFIQYSLISKDNQNKYTDF